MDGCGCSRIRHSLRRAQAVSRLRWSSCDRPHGGGCGWPKRRCRRRPTPRRRPDSHERGGPDAPSRAAQCSGVRLSESALFGFAPFFIFSTTSFHLSSTLFLSFSRGKTNPLNLFAESSSFLFFFGILLKEGKGAHIFPSVVATLHQEKKQKTSQRKQIIITSKEDENTTPHLLRAHE